jgi:hypothetical protein
MWKPIYRELAENLSGYSNRQHKLLDTIKARVTTWNGSRFHLIPVRVTRQKELAVAIPRYYGDRLREEVWALGGKSTLC